VGDATVLTQTMVAPTGLKTSTDSERFLPREIFWLVSDYPNLLTDYTPSPIVVWEEGGMRMFDSPNPGWLAFNPTLTHELKWTYTPELLFGWLDSSGEPAVWSVYWKDGVYETRPPRLHETVAQGWAVVGSRDALRQIQALFRESLTQYRRIEHSHIENREKKIRVDHQQRDLSDA